MHSNNKSTEQHLRYRKRNSYKETAAPSNTAGGSSSADGRRNKKDKLGDRRGQRVGVLTWVSAYELWPGALLGGRGVGSTDQLVFGHLGVGLGELQPQSLGNLWVKTYPLRSMRKIC